MYILAIESSSKILSVALSFKDRVQFQSRCVEGFKSEQIIRLLKKTLEKSQLKFCDLDYIAVGLGPGSFTGLRIGIATALGLAFGSYVKIIGIGSLDVIAASVSDVDKCDICTIVDARRGNLYTALFRHLDSKQGFVLKKKMDYSLLKPGDLLARINSPTLFVGDGLLEFKDTIKRKKSRLAFFATEDLWFPQASVLARLGYESIKNKRTKDKGRGKVLPIYLYPKECQIRDEKNKI